MHQVSLNREQGFTLIEIMVAVALGVIVSAAAFTILTTTSKSVTANEQTVDMQQNARLAMELLSRDIKRAGFGSPSPPVPIGNCTYSIMPSDNATGGVDTGPDSIQLLLPVTRNAAAGALNPWTLQNAVVGGGAQITLKSGAVREMSSTYGMANGSYISINGLLSRPVNNFNATSSTIDVTMSPDYNFPANAQIYLLQCIRYRIVNNPAVCGSNEPCLTRGVVGGAGANAEAPIVEGIEEMQLSYACDGCVAAINSGIPDRIIDNQGGASGFDQADFISDNTWATPPLTPDKIKLVQLTLVARQPKADVGTGETLRAVQGSGLLTVSSDRTLPADGNHRRRLLTKTIETRNVGL